MLYDEVHLSNVEAGASTVPPSIAVGASRAGEQHIVALQPPDLRGAPEALMVARQSAYPAAKPCAEVAQHDPKRFTAPPPLHCSPHEL